MDNFEDPYLKRIELLEWQLEKKIAELRKERECNKEALRYILALVVKLGGRAEIQFSELADQNGVLKCRVMKEKEIVVMRLGKDRKERREDVKEKELMTETLERGEE